MPPRETVAVTSGAVSRPRGGRATARVHPPDHRVARVKPGPLTQPAHRERGNGSLQNNTRGFMIRLGSSARRMAAIASTSTWLL